MGKKQNRHPIKKPVKPKPKVAIFGHSEKEKAAKVEKKAKAAAKAAADKAAADEKTEAFTLLQKKRNLASMTNEQLYTAINNNIKDDVEGFSSAASKIFLERGKTATMLLKIALTYPDIDDNTKLKNSLSITLDGSIVKLKASDQQAMKVIEMALTHDELLFIYSKMF